MAKMKVFIRTSTTGKTFPLKVKGSDTFDVVMAKIKVMPHECSSMQDNCSCLPSDITKMLLLIMSTKCNTITLEVNCSDTFDLVKAKIKDTCSLDIRCELIPKPKGWWRGMSMPIFVRILNNGKIITLALNCGRRISNVTDLIYYQEHIMPYMQMLFFAGMSLEQDRTLDHYNIGAGFTLDLVLEGTTHKPEIILETTNGTEEIPLLALNDRRIKKVKRSIEKMAGISLDQKKLVRPGEELDDARFLRTYEIHDQTTFWIVDDAFMTTRVSMRIYIQFPVTQKTVSLNVETTDTIEAVKAKIQARKGIPTDQQVLFLPYKRLHEDTLTLADYFIPDGFTLYLAQVNMCICHINENVVRT